MSKTIEESRPFIMVPNDILFSKSLNPTEKSILITLMLICYDEDSNTFSLTIKEISKKAMYSENTVRRYLKTLKAKGYLKIEPNYGSKRANLYTLNI